MIKKIEVLKNLKILSKIIIKYVLRMYFEVILKNVSIIYNT